MRFLYNPYSIEMEWGENENCVLQIENKKVFIDLLSDLYYQINHGEGEAILSDGEKCLNIRKSAELIFEPFSLDFNNRKIKNALYQELSVITLQNHYSDYTKICSELQRFMEQIILEIPYALSYQSNIGIEELLKAESVTLDYLYDSLVEKICIYIRLLSGACGINTIFFVELGRYLTREEICEVIKEAQYDKINIIFINTSENDSCNLNSVRYIIDESLCFWKA